MTDKQIIIDGVDVSECENFSCGICEQENKIPRTINHFTADCRMYPNCHYKLYKRKEQECEKLKKECEKLKNQVLTLDDETITVQITQQQFVEYNQLKADNNLFRTCHDNEQEKRRKYEQTLTEIKEIAEKIDDSEGCAYGDYDCDNCSNLEQETVCTYKVKKLILQKISEVLND